MAKNKRVTNQERRKRNVVARSNNNDNNNVANIHIKLVFLVSVLFCVLMSMNNIRNVITATATATAAFYDTSNEPATTEDDTTEDDTDTSIRQWGCAPRTEAPFLFVHIGKAGGGGVRARIAASALDYNSTGNRKAWRYADASAYYPIREEQENPENGNSSNRILHKGRLINSAHHNMLPHTPTEWDKFPFLRTFKFESSSSCHATTPIGHAVACHYKKGLGICDPRQNHPRQTRDDDDNDPNRCDIVYMGHNVLGAELNFLPTPYLLHWWNNSTFAQQQVDAAQSVATRLATRYTRSHRMWTKRTYDDMQQKVVNQTCMDGPLSYSKYKQQYTECTRPEATAADELIQAFFLGDSTGSNSDNMNINYGPLYASLPVLRVTMLREPFSWLKSKFFWMAYHLNGNNSTVGNSLALADQGDAINNRLRSKWNDKKKEKYKDAIYVKCDDEEQLAKGWGRQGALEYIFYLCGEHCMGQWNVIEETYQNDQVLLRQKHLEYLKVMEATASYNLRNSFAVVGLLQETQEFFNMVTQRVEYMDMSLNPTVVGSSHSTGENPLSLRCGEFFQDPALQERVMAKAPELATVVRLYNVGVQVNQFQKEELAQCSLASASASMPAIVSIK